MFDRGHILLIMLLVFLLFSQLSQLEHLKPTLIAEHFRAELDHLAVDGVVRGYVSDQPRIFRLYICYHLHVDLDTFSELAVVESQIFHWGFEIEAMFIPDTPWAFFALLDKVLQVVVRPISQHLEQLKLSLGLGI